ncbi:MAG TPA: type II CAAX endopeptidase family protein [Bryobacteraceae bacterium]|nr:type II CAAX endopeptidase family protein [Bryobacteraceae bacterium]
MTPPLVLAQPDEPFWGFAEIFLALAVFLVAIGGSVAFATHVLHAPSESGLWGVLEEVVAYAILLVALKFLFARHGRKLRDSLGWSKPGPFSVWSLVVVGLSLSLTGLMLQYLLQTPEIETPFQKMLADPASRIAIAVMGVSVGPVIEELLFRGFLQPVLIGSAGVFPGILITSLIFGALHLNQNGNLWQSGVVIMVVGFVLGTVRHVTGSTRASTVVHIAYNALPMVVLLVEGAINPNK